MEVEIVTREKDPVIDREYIRFKVKHVSEPTPSRQSIKQELVKEISSDKELLTVVKIQSRYGRPISDGEAFLYEDQETKEKFSRSYLIERTGEMESEEEEKEEAAEEEKKERGTKGEEPEEKEEAEEEGEEEKEGVECPECGKVFDTERGMKIHKSKSH